jgi:putative nucleotidyltransferase with HDIG domain
LIESDPALSTQVIRLANTAFYGLSGKVASAWRAVTVLGLATVRALATTAAFDLFSEKGRSVPDDFWPHSVTAAAASSCVARRLGHQSNDAFSAGLLHDLGTALMFRRAPRRYDAVLERMQAGPILTLIEAEQAEFGITHAEVGAAALSVMKFPPDLTAAIATHHLDPALIELPLGKIVLVGDAIACVLQPTTETNISVPEALAAIGLPPESEAGLLEEVQSDQEKLAGFLTVSG